MEFFATIGLITVTACIVLIIYGMKNGTFKELIKYAKSKRMTKEDSISAIKHNEQLQQFNPESQFDLKWSMSDRFDGNQNLPYIKSFDPIIKQAEECRDYLYNIVFSKKGDISIPTRWLVERDQAMLELRKKLKSAKEAYEEHLDGKPQRDTLQKLNYTTKRYLNELWRIEDAIRELLAVTPPEKRKNRTSTTTPK